jgi:hypothetical protein
MVVVNLHPVKYAQYCLLEISGLNHSLSQGAGGCTAGLAEIGGVSCEAIVPFHFA